jgi:hypothetical protein
MFLRTLPVGFMASSPLLLSMFDLAIAQRSGVIGSAPTDSARRGVIGGGYRGAAIGRRERRVGSIRTPTRAMPGLVGCGSGINPNPIPPHASPQAPGF